jgi:acetyltransferase-like isoleucine patch superfamily enzyme
MNLLKKIYNFSILKISSIVYGYIKGIGLNISGNVIVNKNVVIGDYTTLLTSDNGKIIIEEGSSIGRDSWIAAGSGKITIGSQCLFGPRVTIVGQNHALKDVTVKNYLPWDLDDDGRKTELGMRCHVGANVTIVPGVKIGDYSLIAANSVVTKNFGSGSVIAGIPARLLKTKTIPKNIPKYNNEIPPYINTSRMFWT